MSNMMPVPEPTAVSVQDDRAADRRHNLAAEAAHKRHQELTKLLGDILSALRSIDDKLSRR